MKVTFHVICRACSLINDKNREYIVTDTRNIYRYSSLQISTRYTSIVEKRKVYMYEYKNCITEERVIYSLRQRTSKITIASKCDYLYTHRTRTLAQN